MHRLHAIALLLCLTALSTFAAEPAIRITSVFPDTGTHEGGTLVTIRGENFLTCVICSPPIPPAVFFGGTRAAGIMLRNETTLVAVAPAHAPGLADVNVVQWDGSSEDVLRDGFAFVVESNPAHSERLLLPIFLPPVQGAHGAEFRTRLTAVNTGGSDVNLYGLERICILSACPIWDPLTTPVALYAGEEVTSEQLVSSGKPGRFIYVPAPHLHALGLNLRVWDTSRDAQNFGTELPVVRSSSFRTDRIVLPAVPLDARFRRTLRIYSTGAIPVSVTIGTQQRRLTLAPGATIFDPAYAEISDFPAGEGTVTVTIEREPCGPISGPCMPPMETGFWAIVSVTNNDTQMITTITPQP